MKELILLVLKFVSAGSQTMRSPDKQNFLCAIVPWLWVAAAAVGHCQGGRSLPAPGERFEAGLQAGSLRTSFTSSFHWLNTQHKAFSRTVLSLRG